MTLCSSVLQLLKESLWFEIAVSGSPTQSDNLCNYCTCMHVYFFGTPQRFLTMHTQTLITNPILVVACIVYCVFTLLCVFY